MSNQDSIIQWLLDGDPAIRWQTMRDLTDSPETEFKTERQKIVEHGWGAALLALQESSGKWGGGIYSPKWISTTYTMLLLRRLGLPPRNHAALKSCKLLLDKGLYLDGGINYFKSLNCGELCVTGMILSLVSYFQLEDERTKQLVNYILKKQMNDGGWNCQYYKGARHSSFHTTINVLEGLRDYEKSGQDYLNAVKEAQAKGREFLLMHRLFKSDKTSKIIRSEFTRFSFPPRWHYDVLRALDYFQECKAERDERLFDAIELLKSKRNRDDRWNLQNRHSGRTFFEMEDVGKPSRWNTLRALRVFKWWEKE